MPEKLEGPYRRVESRQFSKDAEFGQRPSVLVLVAGLEIVVRDDYGDYLLITSPHYEEVELPKGKRRPSKIEDGFWTVPYITKTVPAHTGGYRHGASTIETIDKEVHSWKPQPLLEDYVATFSFGVPKIAPVGAFCELKHSWSQPHITKLYHVMRYSVELTSCAHRNLADASSRKGYAFLPIDDRYRTVTRRRKCGVHKLRETLYREQPLASNLAVVLEDEDERRVIRSRATRLEKEHFAREYAGLLFCGDIAGYGAASAYAEDHMGGLTDADHGAILRDSATVAFTDLFLDAGIGQIHIAGDGFICAMPLDKPSDAAAGLKRFATAYAAYLRRLEDLNARIGAYYDKNATGDDPPLVGSRLAIHYGAYRHGKMSQAASLVTSFDGAEIVRVSRLEQALRAVKKDSELATEYKIVDSLHVSAASRAVVKVLQPDRVVLSGIFRTATQFGAASKEFQEQAWLLRAINEPIHEGSGRKPTGRADDFGRVAAKRRGGDPNHP
jgi:hypothetical protein